VPLLSLLEDTNVNYDHVSGENYDQDLRRPSPGPVAAEDDDRGDDDNDNEECNGRHTTSAARRKSLRSAASADRESTPLPSRSGSAVLSVPPSPSSPCHVRSVPAAPPRQPVAESAASTMGIPLSLPTMRSAELPVESAVKLKKRKVLDKEIGHEGRKRKSDPVGDEPPAAKRSKRSKRDPPTLSSSAPPLAPPALHSALSPTSPTVQPPTASSPSVFPPAAHSPIQSSSLPVATASTPSASGALTTSVVSSVAASAQQLPENCLPAIKLTVKLLTSGSLGSKWNIAVNTWLRFEALYNYKGVSQLSATSRPPEVHLWIKSGRTPRCPSAINLAKYQKDFWAWWEKIQPDGRKVKLDTSLRLVSGDWAALDKPGANGVASVMAALFFWGSALRDDPGQAASWNCALDDVSWVLQQLCLLRSA